MNYRNFKQSRYKILWALLLLFPNSLLAQSASTAETKNFYPQDNGATIAGQMAQPSQQDSFTHRFRWGLDVLPFARTTAFAEELGTVNPNNRVAELSKLSFNSYFRPRFNYRLSKDRELLSVWIKPRLNLDFAADQGLLEETATEEFVADFFFQEFKAKWQINQSLYLLAGRYLKEMGTSIFINPSNPFLPNPGRLNPKLEQRPMDFIELNFATKTDWNFSLIANIHQAQNPNYEFPSFDFARSYGLQTEYYGASANIGALLSIDENRKYHLGVYGQKNIGEAVVVWTDASLSYNINRFYPIRGHWTDPQLLDFDMVSTSENDRLFPVALLGASYTLNAGPTIQLEYLYNGQGYTEEEFDLFTEMVASSSLYNFDVTKDLSNINLGRAINPGMPYIRRHYAFVQVNQNDVWDRLNYNLRYIYSFEDQSHQTSALLEWNIGRVELFTVLFANFGGRDTDLNRLIDSQLMFGAKYALF